MFSKPIDEIKYEDLKVFTDQYPEGMRVEYKSEIGKNKIPRGVSSLANSFGGFFIIGAKTDLKTNMVTDLDGIPDDPGLRERILQSCLDGIYPPINPEIKLIKLKNKNIVVLIRVSESPDAPHAIQNSSRIYVRVGEVTDTNDFSKEADIRRIEYLLERRKGYQLKKEKYLKLSEERFSKVCSRPLSWGKVPILSLCASPFSTISPVIPLNTLEEFFNGLDINTDRPALEMLRDSDRGFSKGYDCIFGFSVPPGGSTETWLKYSELNILGQAFFKKSLERTEGGKIATKELIRWVTIFLDLLRKFHVFSKVYGHCEITLSLENVSGVGLITEQNEHQFQPKVCHDDYARSEASGFIPERKDRQGFTEMVESLLNPITWSFDYQIPSPLTLDTLINNIASQYKLIE